MRNRKYNKEDFERDNVKLAYQLGIKFEASAAWKLFRCRADDDKGSRVKRLSEAIYLLSSGEYSIREVCSLTGYAKNTINNLLHKVRAMREKQGLDEIRCPCGTPTVEHRGWCSFRYNKSEKRQEFIRNTFHNKCLVV